MNLPIFRPRYVGTLEGVAGRHICGWVVDRKRARDRVIVQVRRAGSAHRTICADVYRADVQDAGMSDDGYCGFRVPLALVDGQGPIFVKLSPRHRSTRMPSDSLPNASSVFAGLLPSSGRHSSLDVQHKNKLIYGVARVGSTISGFVLDPKDPAAKRAVTLIAEGDASSVQSACRFDEHAKLDSQHDGFNGFVFPYAAKPMRLLDTETGLVLASWSR